jgi:hypothetical protein
LDQPLGEPIAGWPNRGTELLFDCAATTVELAIVPSSELALAAPNSVDEVSDCVAAAGFRTIVLGNVTLTSGVYG